MYKKGRVNSNSRIISTDEDPSLRIESSAIINLRGVSTKLNKYIVFTMQTYKKLITLLCLYRKDSTLNGWQLFVWHLKARQWQIVLMNLKSTGLKHSWPCRETKITLRTLQHLAV